MEELNDMLINLRRSLADNKNKLNQNKGTVLARI